MKFKIMFFIILIILLGCNPIDMSKAEVTFRQTITLPAGFSIVSSVPLDLAKLNELGAEKSSSKIYEKEKFSVPIEIKNNKQKHYNTKIKLDYSPNTIEYLYLYASDGQPLKILNSGLYEFDKDVYPEVKTTLYIAGETKEIPADYPYVGIDLRLSYLNESNFVLASNTYHIEAYKRNYTIPMNTS